VSRGNQITEVGHLVEGVGLPQFCWINSNSEDPAQRIGIPRLKAVGADVDHVLVTEDDLTFPDDLGLVRERLDAFRANGAPIALAVFDSTETHFQNPYHGFRQCKRVMKGLNAINVEYDMSIVLIHHFRKGKFQSVHAAIGGLNILQNQCKAIFAVGEHMSTLGTLKRYMAVERINWEPPKSLSFSIETARVGKQPQVPYFSYAGFADCTAKDILDASKAGETGTGAQISMVEAAAWYASYFEAHEYRAGSMADLEREATRAGMWFSAGTNSRARAMAGVQALRTKREMLEAIGPEEFARLPEDCRPPKSLAFMPKPVPKAEGLQLIEGLKDDDEDQDAGDRST
jgi:hypothetical protein